MQRAGARNTSIGFPLYPHCSTAKAFADVCADVGEADDVTLGIITGVSPHVRTLESTITPMYAHAHAPYTGAVLRYPMVRTNLIHTHGHNLADSVNPRTLREQVCATPLGAGEEGVQCVI